MDTKNTPLRADGTCPCCERDYAGHVELDGFAFCTADDCPAKATTPNT